MNVELTARTITEARLDAAQVAELTSRPEGIGPQVVLQTEGLGSPQQWTAELPTAADRIVVEYGSGRGRFERAWALSAQTDSTRYYTLEHDIDGGYVSR
ncbi:hypothetical protein ASF88_04255 [Leifsonia sp. Leaf336]|uniref:hypothetical protein n=1 Tax=Leifsonia sp. Leaf336 TaxID=1736341 RepID=UPI0006FB87BA|nr:hypothetical protein [Leifsonia sp. Leaf336]KQR54054.1 hypothetical protein ASF88_04255 [Leifsonia sp. Leaf336]